MSNVEQINKKRQTTHKDLTCGVVEGFEQLDDHLLDKKAPKITWMPKFLEQEAQVQNEYLKKLASTMNNAAKLISDERDALVELMVKKEKQLEAMSKQLEMNNKTVQDQVMRMNQQKQFTAEEVSRLNRRIKELESER